MSRKERLSASVDAELIAAGQGAVESGLVDNFSAWVNQALSRQVDHDRRMRALDDLIAAYEAEHGEITDDELLAASRDARTRAVVVRGEHGIRAATASKPGFV